MIRKKKVRKRPAGYGTLTQISGSRPNAQLILRFRRDLWVCVLRWRRAGATEPTQTYGLLKLNLSRKNPAQLIELAEIVIAKLAPAAPATPPVPNMSAKVTSLTTKKTAAKTANDAYEAALAALPNLKQARDVAADALRTEHSSVASGVESEAKGDAVMLTASGYPLAQTPVQSTAVPEQVKNLSVTASDMDGAVDVQYDPVENSTYEVQLTTGDPVTGTWTTKAHPTASKCTLGELSSGSRVWVRVRAINSNGPGPWSDPASKIVP